jgi:hypothetical protein
MFIAESENGTATNGNAAPRFHSVTHGPDGNSSTSRFAPCSARGHQAPDTNTELGATLNPAALAPRSASASLRALPTLAADLFMQFVRGKNGIQNKCEQN